jgi:hypothetical protein
MIHIETILIVHTVIELRAEFKLTLPHFLQGDPLFHIHPGYLIQVWPFSTGGWSPGLDRWWIRGSRCQLGKIHPEIIDSQNML